MTQRAQANLKEAKEVMEDEGGANQASLKKQQVEQQEQPKQQEKQDEPGSCCTASPKPE